MLQADVRVCKIEQIAIGVGLLGRLFRVHLDGGPDLPATVVVKLPTLDVTARVTLCEAAEFYLREVRFYQEIGLTNPLPPAQPYFAAFDEATHDFVLVLEDLRSAPQRRPEHRVQRRRRRDGHRRHRPPPRPLVGQRSPRVAALAEDLHRAPVL